MLKTEHIYFSYDTQDVLKDISLDVGAGDWVGLLGPNGSGKTTLLKIFSGYLRPRTGTVRLSPSPLVPVRQRFSGGGEGRLPADGVVAGGEGDIFSLSRSTIARTIAVVPQETNVFLPFTAFDVVMMGRFAYRSGFGFDTKEDIAAARHAMELTGTTHLAGRSISELSGGERQRVIIARALAQGPKILLLDEPTAFLDIKHQQEILLLLKRLNTEHGLTIISSMHDINLALLYCKRIVFLRDGAVFGEGLPAQVVTYANLKEVFGTEVYVGINDLNGKPYYLPYSV